MELFFNFWNLYKLLQNFVNMEALAACDGVQEIVFVLIGNFSPRTHNSGIP